MIAPAKSSEAPFPTPLAYSVADAARAVAVCERSLRGEIATGRLSVVRLGTRVIIRRIDLEAWLESHLKPYKPAAVGRGSSRRAE
jgi:excisionase family DNA binding protein